MGPGCRSWLARSDLCAIREVFLCTKAHAAAVARRPEGVGAYYLIKSLSLLAVDGKRIMSTTVSLRVDVALSPRDALHWKEPLCTERWLPDRRRVKKQAFCSSPTAVFAISRGL